MKTKLPVLAFAALWLACLLAPPLLQAGDLDAPGAKVVTVRSEIQRGAAVSTPYPSRSCQQFEDAIRRIDELNVQNNTDSHGFLLGLHLQAWQSLWRVLDSGLYKATELDFAQIATERHYRAFHNQRDFLGLSPEQVSECVPPYKGTDDEAWEKAYSSKRFRATYPHLTK